MERFSVELLDMTSENLSVDIPQNFLIWNHESEDSEMSLQPQIDCKGTSFWILASEDKNIGQDFLLLTVISIKDLT